MGRLLNHSRTAGNCMVRVLGIEGKPYLAILAANTSQPGDELLFDYGDRSKLSIEAYPWLAN